ncbi:A24 family peptidase [Ferrimicrobium sp.]|uniref:prepilin peptidase n=1 Tax=Ferrimicrobium sp. TaxID=2926050 RepID=UPI0026161F86|nr:A24 family peptidase [Ferrimicrobium sp.]
MGVVIGLVFGLIGGSALTALTFRVPAGLPLVMDRSKCPSCAHPIRARDNVPVFAYLWLRGRCRDCSVSIPLRYPLTELAGGAIGVIAAMYPVDSVDKVSCGLALLVGLGAALIDQKTYRIPNSLTYPTAVLLVLLGFVNALFSGHWRAFTVTVVLAIAVLAFFVLLRLVSRGGMGLGDAKLAAVLVLGVAPFGAWSVAVAILVSFFVGSVVGIALILAKRASLRAQLPFGPFLTFGFVITTLGVGIFH